MASIQTDITYWSTTLKVWIANWVNDNALKEEYGEGCCKCSWLRLILATSLLDELQCYTISSSYNLPSGDTPTEDNCLDDADMRHLFQVASSIINFRGDC